MVTQKTLSKPKYIINTDTLNTREGGKKMRERMDKKHIEELKEMIKEKENTEPVEKVLVKFCERHGVSIDTCRIYYRHLVDKGEIHEK
jgi:glutamate synthase domain-containing protein 2